MKTWKHLMTKITDFVIKESLRVGTKRKKDRPSVQEIIKNYDKSVIGFKQFIDNILSGKQKPIVHRVKEINDGFKLKKRMIMQPYFTKNLPEQWLHHLIIQILQPIFMKGMYEFSCSSIPNRGVHYGKKHLEKYLREHKGKVRYVLKADIRHFYDTVNVDIVKDRFRKIIKDADFLKLIFFVLDSNTGYTKEGKFYKTGLPIGFYTSQWFANWFLQPFDHYIKEELKADFYMRYADDIVILGNNKRKLHKMLAAIKEYLKSVDLELKPNYQIFQFDYIGKDGKHYGRFIDFMGFKFYSDRTTIRKAIFIRACRLARRLKKKIQISWYNASRMLSYIGWFIKTKTFMAKREKIESNVNRKGLAKIISMHDYKLAKQLKEENILKKAG
jgi:hypothetical protein